MTASGEPSADEAVAVPLFDASIAVMRATLRTAKVKPPQQAAAELPYAQVAVDIDLSHLDRTYDYLVPAELDADAQPGVRIRCRFGERVVDGYIVNRAAESSFDGRFGWIQTVVSLERVLTPEIAALARIVADRYAGTVADVLRLAIPPRHAAAEKKAAKESAESAAVAAAKATAAVTATAEPESESGVEVELKRRPVDTAPWEPYAGGLEFLAALSGAVVMTDGGSSPANDAMDAGAGSEYPALRDDEASADSSTALLGAPHADGWQPPMNVAAVIGHVSDPTAPPRDVPHPSPRAVWTCLPGADWSVALASAIHAIADAGRGALAVVPDKRDLARLDRALTAALGPDRHVVLAEDLGPSKRYRNWLAVLRGEVRVAIGTRAAMFAPVGDLGLVAVWDDGDDLHADQHAPYPHVREVLALRAHQTGAAALIGGYACTAEGAQLVETGWARPLIAPRSVVRAASPLIRTSGEEREQDRDAAAKAARLPNLAWRTAREALAHGPVLIQVPRGGYAPALACVRCRTHARCENCHGPLALTSGHAMAHCGWCGRPAGGWHCTGVVDDRPCGEQRFRLVVVGVQRTAEELGRAFPGVPVISSAAQDTIVAEVSARPALVVATPGAEPVAEGGYAAALLLDGWALLGRRDLRANEEALRRWFNAAALVRPAKSVTESPGGVVVVMAEPSLPPVQALLRWDPVWHARRELGDRAELHYPPYARVAELTGTPAAVAEELQLLHLPDGAEVLGPVVVDSPWDSAKASAADTVKKAAKPSKLGRVKPPEAPRQPVGPAPETHRALVRVPRRQGAELAASVRAAQGVRSARKAEDWVRVRVDPMQIG